MKYTVNCTIFPLDKDGKEEDGQDLDFTIETDENPIVTLKNLLREHKGVADFCT